MKATLIAIALCFVYVFSHAQSQNELKARVEFEKAEEEFNLKNYAKSLEHLDQANKFIGEWTPIVSYLRIENLISLTPNFQDLKNPALYALYQETKKYTEFMSKESSQNIPEEKFKRVYEVDKKLPKHAIQQYYHPDLMQARKEFEQEKFKQAFVTFEQLANANNPYAMKYLGDMYLYGLHVPVDRNTSQQWYEKAVRAGNLEANVGLSRLIIEGNILKSSAKASNLSEMLHAAEKNNDADADYWLGVVYADGIGVQADFVKAKSYLSRVKPNNKKFPKLEYYNALVKLYSFRDLDGQTEFLLANSTLFPQETTQKILEQNQAKLMENIKKQRGNILFFSIFGTAMCGASTYFFIDKGYTGGVCMGLLGGLSVWGALALASDQSYIANKKTLDKINKAPQFNIRTTSFQFQNKNHIGLQLAYQF